jgi:hypothetical protein
MDIRWIGFGAIEIEGRRYDHDVVIDAGRITKRRKAPSKAHRDRYGHTPLSNDEQLPWGGDRLIIGTGASGQLPIMDEVRSEAVRRGIHLDCLPTADACRVLERLASEQVHAVLHLTC